MTYHFPDYIPKSLGGEFFRFDSHVLNADALLDLVDTFEEYSLLEQMIESSKSQTPFDKFNLNYLLSSPFRNPPLERGSRFGTRYEPNLFYASLDQRTCMAEVAFYRFVFFHSTEEPLPNNIKSKHLLFSSIFLTDRGLDLTEPPFSVLRDELCHQSDYSFTQSLGKHLRDNGDIDCFLYESARNPPDGINIAFFNPRPFKQPNPNLVALWHSQVTCDTVTFKEEGCELLYVYSIKEFTDEDGNLPFPMC